MPRFPARALAATILCLVCSLPARARDYTITVSAPSHDYPACPVFITINAPPSGLTLTHNGAAVPVQARTAGGKLLVTWIVPERTKGASVRYRLSVGRSGTPA